MQKSNGILCIFRQSQRTFNTHITLQQVDNLLFEIIIVHHFDQDEAILIFWRKFVVERTQSGYGKEARNDVEFSYAISIGIGKFGDKVPNTLDVQTIVGIAVEFVVDEHKSPYAPTP